VSAQHYYNRCFRSVLSTHIYILRYTRCCWLWC